MKRFLALTSLWLLFIFLAPITGRSEAGGEEGMIPSKTTFSADGRYVASMIDDGQVGVWAVDTHNLVCMVQPPDNILDIDIDTSASKPQMRLQLYDGRIAVTDLAENAPLRWIVAGTHKMNFNEGKMLAYGWQVQISENYRIRYLVDLASNKEWPINSPVSTDHTVFSVLFSSDGQDVAVYTNIPIPFHNGYSIWRSHRGPEGFTKFIGLSRAWIIMDQVLMSKDGSRIVAIEARPKEAVKSWGRNARQTITIDCLGKLPPWAGQSPGQSMALSDDGELFAFGSIDDNVHIYSALTGKHVAEADLRKVLRAAGIFQPWLANQPEHATEQYTNSISAVAISPNKKILCIQLGLQAILWNRVTGDITILPQPPYKTSPYRGPMTIG